MGVIVADNFDRAPGILETPWVNLTGPTASVTTAGRLRCTSSSSARYVLPGDYPAEYKILVDITRLGSSSGGVPGVIGRVVDSENQYTARFNASTGRWELYILGGTTSVLDVWSDSFPLGATRKMEFVVTDDSKLVYVDGVLRLASSNNTLTSGASGVRFNSGSPVSDTEGYHLDNFRVVTLDHVDGGIPLPLLEGYI